MNIGIDIDDTISNTHDILFSYAQKYTVEDLKKKIIPPKDGKISGNGYCKRFHGWTDEEEYNFFTKYYEIIIEQLSVKKFAKEVIEKIRKKGNKIFLITARFELPNCDIKKTTIDWLQKNEIEYDEIVFNARDKLKVVKEKKIEIMLDDAIPNCRQIAKSGIKTLLMDSMENQQEEILGVPRIYSWIHAEQEINKILKN